jgi:hypothetical protein
MGTPDLLHVALRAASPTLSLRSEAIIDAMLLSGGSIGTEDDVARRLGFANRFQLSRSLTREHLPPLHELAAWASILHWVQQAERTGAGLTTIAIRSRRDSGDSYRLVKHTTGLTWHDLRLLGYDWCATRFLERVRIALPTGRRTPHEVEFPKPKHVGSHSGTGGQTIGHSSKV